MKKINFTISVEQEKLTAIQLYTAKRNTSLQVEMDAFLQKLYEKYVPAQTREYIECQEEMAQESSKRPSRAASSPIHDAGTEDE